jgi:hypothetical protein
MQTETLEKTTAKVTPYNEVAELIDREIHAKTPRANQCFGA